MTALRWPVLAAAVLLGAAIAADGTDPMGRLMVRLGLPGTGAAMIADPADRGRALYRAGRHAEATIAFAEAGDAYNQGLAEAWAGRYSGALAAWDRALARDPGDAEARANHAIVRGLLAGTEFEPVPRPEDGDRDGPEMAAEIGQGGARAASTGDDATESRTGFWMPEVLASGVRTVANTFDAQYIAADGRWLTTLEDQPGLYLRARLAAEQKARETNGVALPPAEDPR